MNSKRRWIFIVGIAFAAFAAGLLYRSKLGQETSTPLQKRAGEVAAISNQADPSVDSELNQAFLARNWPAVRTQLKQAQNPTLDFGNTIRSGLARGLLKDFTPADISEINSIGLETLSGPSQKDFFGSALLKSQLEHLPYPAANSEASKNWLSYARDPKSELHDLAVNKVLAGSPRVPDDIFRSFENEVAKPANDAQIRNQLQVIGEMQDTARQKLLIEKSEKQSASYSVENQIQLLRTLNKMPKEIRSSSLSKSLALKTFESRDLTLLGASLNFARTLQQNQELSPGEIIQFQKKIAAIPKEILTPADAQEVQQTLKLLAPTPAPSPAPAKN